MHASQTFYTGLYCMYVYVQLHMLLSAHKGQVRTLDVLSSNLIALRQGLSLNPKVAALWHAFKLLGAVCP